MIGRKLLNYEILERLGSGGMAFERIEWLLANPAGFSVNRLEQDPRYDGLREDPRYAEMLAKYGNQVGEN